MGAAALGIASYFGVNAYTCSAHEDDYLNALASIRGNIALGALVENEELDQLRKQQDELYWKAAEAALAKLYSDCSERAAKNAHRKGQDMLLGLTS